jgi:hypothetical protein
MYLAFAKHGDRPCDRSPGHRNRVGLRRVAAPEVYFPVLALVTFTFTWRGLVSSRFGRVMVSTPFLY